MQNNKNITFKRLDNETFIRIFKFEDVKNVFFSNYQRYDFFQLIWFTKVGDNDSYFIDFEEYTICKDQLVLVFPGQIDRLDVDGYEGYIFAIDADSFFRISQHINSDYLNGYFSNVILTLDEETKKTIEKLNELIQLEYNTYKRTILLESYMEAFLFHMSSLFENSYILENRSDSTVGRIMKLIDENFINERETDFYAVRLGYTQKKINQICVKGTGRTVKQHLQDRLILEIKKEIRLREKSFKEIAFDLGFNEPAYFTRFFKKHTSQTPKEFRDS